VFDKLPQPLFSTAGDVPAFTTGGLFLGSLKGLIRLPPPPFSSLSQGIKAVYWRGGAFGGVPLFSSFPPPHQTPTISRDFGLSGLPYEVLHIKAGLSLPPFPFRCRVLSPSPLFLPPSLVYFPPSPCVISPTQSRCFCVDRRTESVGRSEEGVLKFPFRRQVEEDVAFSFFSSPSSRLFFSLGSLPRDC